MQMIVKLKPCYVLLKQKASNVCVFRQKVYDSDARQKLKLVHLFKVAVSNLDVLRMNPDIKRHFRNKQSRN